MFDKIWQNHVVHHRENGTCLLYIDRHLVHEVTSPQAFEGLRKAGRHVRRPETALAVVDHNIPTVGRSGGILDPKSKLQVETLEQNCSRFGISLFGINDIRQGIVHIVGPEQGMTHPGMTVVCGDSHTSTHGAFGALAFGIGTSEVEHVLATQTLLMQPLKNMRVSVVGPLSLGVSAKDLIMAIIARIGTAGGTGHVIEYSGSTIVGLSMEGRMTICNMSVEAGARAGLIAPDEVTFSWLKGRPLAPQSEHWEQAITFWRSLPSDSGAHYDREITLNAAQIAPLVTWGTSPEDVVPITGRVPYPESFQDKIRVAAAKRSIDYMGLTAGTPMTEIAVDRVFIGSCTNGRIEDLRQAAKIAVGRRVHERVHALVVPGSGLVKTQAEAEGLDRVFRESGFDWRDPGCSMCLAMNADRLEPGQRCASTSNRNFEGRQGYGGRTHLVSPAMAAAAAIAGHLIDVREFNVN
jgi:3-isopropylmalate/(R)-2-methylmalate dehydratase large subunit